MTTEYQKIDTLYKRDPENLKRLVIDDWANPAFEYLANNKWVFTEKVDGTNIRIIIPKESRPVYFGGKTDGAQIPATLVTKLQEIFLGLEIETKLFAMFPDGACLYGEGYGAKIQKGGGNYRQGQSFVLFDVLVNDTVNNKQWWLERHNIEDIATKLGLDIVPIVGIGTLHTMVEMAKHGFTSTWGNFIAEGIVAKPQIELKDRAGRRIITKIKHKDFKVS